MEKPTLEQTPKMIQSLLKRFELFERKLDRFLIESNDQNENPLSIDDASEILDLSKPSLYIKARKGELPSHKKGGKLYFFKSELLAWVKSGKCEDVSVQLDNEISKK